LPTQTRRREVDVVIIGAGLAGISAAVTAAASGARTLVLERGESIGGSAIISGGYVWALADRDILHREDPGKYQRHGHVVVDGYRSAIDWLSGFAPALTQEQPNLAGRGQKFDLSVVFAHLLRSLFAAGGDVICDCRGCGRRSDRWSLLCHRANA
jgi:tricarballylate dehydrogenase